MPEWLGPHVRLRKVVHVHRAHDQIVQVIGIHLEACTSLDRPWVPVLVAFEALEKASDLEPARVRAVLMSHHHLPESERWAALRALISGLARPIDDVFRRELLAEAREAGAAHENCVMVDTGELFWIEDELARSLVWVAWHAGKIDELRVDRDFVRRLVAPGTFLAPRAVVTAKRETDVRPPELPGLRFMRLVLQAPDATLLRIATPAIPDELTPQAVEWIAHFLPILRDPYSTLLLDVRPDGRAEWSIDMRSTLLEVHSDRGEPLVEGRALVVPPWTWRRVALVFPGV